MTLIEAISTEFCKWTWKYSEDSCVNVENKFILVALLYT